MFCVRLVTVVTDLGRMYQKAGTLWSHVNNIPAQECAELATSTTGKGLLAFSLPGTEVVPKNQAAPPSLARHNGLFFAQKLTAYTEDHPRYREVSQAHLQISGSAPGGPGVEIHQHLEHPFSSRDNIMEASRAAPSPHHFHLPRAELPKFSGKLTEWPEFHRCFRAMADHQYSPLIYLMQLKSKLTKEGQSLLAGVTNVEHA